MVTIESTLFQIHMATEESIQLQQQESSAHQEAVLKKAQVYSFYVLAWFLLEVVHSIRLFGLAMRSAPILVLTGSRCTVKCSSWIYLVIGTIFLIS